ncbi:MAG: TfoX/Sxy family protein [Candidatus Aenigmarchaeota archaeon]|nr:TfoX/Sxy family protein [Candidatus Aenigmarchaeota archaeon]
MAYDNELAERIRETLKGRKAVTEKEMFGGIAFLLDGKMFCGVQKGDFMARVGKERHAEAIAKPHARPMDFTGRPMAGFVYVRPEGVKGKGLEQWVGLCLEYVSTLKGGKK